MPECRTVRHLISPVPDWKKLTMPGLVWYRTKPRQSGFFLVWYRTGIIDAGMPMSALVSSMPMPSYARRQPYLSLPLWGLTVCGVVTDAILCLPHQTKIMWLTYMYSFVSAALFILIHGFLHALSFCYSHQNVKIVMYYLLQRLKLRRWLKLYTTPKL